MGIMINRNACRGKLTLFLVAVTVLAGAQTGLGENQDIEQLRQAAEEGDASAQYELGAKYDWGWGVAEDHEKAVKWYRLAAEQGNVEAQRGLGFKYALGEGVWEDDQEAVKWWRKAAKQGDASAQSMLGNMYYEGRGVPDDYREAAQWYQKAAKQGDASAQGRLGFMYARGEGVGKDYVKAYAWASLAAAQGKEMPVTPKIFGIEGKETTLKAWLREQMTSRQMGRAQKLAAEIFNRIESSKSK